MLAEYVVIREDEAVAVPRTLDDVHAATLPIAGVTAWHAVVRRSQAAAGQSLARLGEVRTIDRRTADVEAAVPALTGGAGVDHVVQTIGGSNLELSLRTVRLGGSIAFVGLLAGLTAEVST